MPIWKTKPVHAESQITLARWHIIETETGERHFVGYNGAGMEGRVSSAIQQFDVETLRGVTKSGRVYALAGPPGYDSDALYVLQIWAYTNGVTRITNVTEAALGEKKAHRREQSQK